MEGWTQLTVSRLPLRPYFTLLKENTYSISLETAQPSDMKVGSFQGAWGEDLSGFLDVSKINNQWGLMLAKAVEANQFIIEFQGRVALLKDVWYLVIIRQSC
jgi:hypothetical protein